MAFSVRELRQGDEEAWRALWTGYLAYYETRVDEAVYRETFRRLLSGDSREFRGLVAEDEAGKPIGLAHYLVHRHCWRIDDVTYLQDLYVEPDARDLGVGRALIEAVYRAADEAGASSVYWLTEEFNAPARVLYDRIGRRTPFLRYNR